MIKSVELNENHSLRQLAFNPVIKYFRKQTMRRTEIYLSTKDDDPKIKKLIKYG